MVKYVLAILILFGSLQTHCEEPPVAEEVTVPFLSLDQTQIRRANASYFVLANYAPWDLVIPSKMGLTLGWIESAAKTWEFEYLRGSISVPYLIADLGSMTDVRYSIITRSYANRSSFNFSYGVTYFDFTVHLGDQLLNRVSGGATPSMDLIQIQSLGVNFGIGNRWSFNRNITVGIDWLSWAQPLVALNKNSAFLNQASIQHDKDDVEKGISIVSYFPRFSVLKIQVGILF